MTSVAPDNGIIVMVIMIIIEIIIEQQVLAMLILTARRIIVVTHNATYALFCTSNRLPNFLSALESVVFRLLHVASHEVQAKLTLAVPWIIVVIQKRDVEFFFTESFSISYLIISNPRLIQNQLLLIFYQAVSHE
jgi:hypothetical protein